MPHSRYNELREDDLRRAGYRILTNSPKAGVDMFMKARRNCTFLFFQGHPEYERGTLLREYRRDALRFFNGERDEYPIMPFDYFAPDVERRLAQVEMRAKAARSPDFAAELPLPEDEAGKELGGGRWAAPATMIYRNWLNHIVAVKHRAHIEWPLVETWWV
jgi:homoserine O-succinyltransferase